MARQVLNAVFPLLKAEWALSDTQLGALSGGVALMVGLLTFPLSTTTYSYQGSVHTTYTAGSPIPTLNVPIGDSVLVMICTAEDSLSSTRYTLNIHRSVVHAPGNIVCETSSSH